MFNTDKPIEKIEDDLLNITTQMISKSFADIEVMLIKPLLLFNNGLKKD